MKSSPSLWLAVGVLLGVFVAGATMAIAQNPSAMKPADVQGGSECEDRAVKHLLQATDPLQSAQQEWNLNAAEAYRELAAMGFKEC